MQLLPLEAVFDAAGAIAWAAIVAFLVELLKRFTPLAETGRAPMYACAALAAALVALAFVDGAAPAGPFGFSIVVGVLAWANVTTAAIGSHQVVTKTARVLAGTTDPTGPDDAP